MSEETEIARLRAENGKLRAGIAAVRDLIAESGGVAGLHLNGDVAPWDTLLTGGQFEEWLHPFSEAMESFSSAEWDEKKERAR